MIALLRQRNFDLLWVAGIISLLGDWILYTIFPFYIAKTTGSALATAMMALIEVLPGILLGTVAGVFIDRWKPRWTMMVCDLLRAFTLLLLFLPHPVGELWPLYLVAFLETSISVFFQPAQTVLLRQVVIPKDLLTANALNSLSSNSCRLLGPVLGGLLFLLLGLHALVLIDVLSYILSAVLIGRIFLSQSMLASEQERVEQSTLSMKGKAFWHELSEGLHFMVRERWLLLLCICMAAAMLGQGICNALLALFAEKVVGMSAEAYGWYLSAQGIGGIVGGLLIGKVGKALRPASLLGISLLGAGGLLLLQSNIPSLPVACISITLVGIFVVGWIVALQSIFQVGIDTSMLGRVSGTYGTLQMVALLLGTTGGGLVANFWGIIPVLNIAGALLLLSGIASLYILKQVTIQWEMPASSESHQEPESISS